MNCSILIYHLFLQHCWYINKGEYWGKKVNTNMCIYIFNILNGIESKYIVKRIQKSYWKNGRGDSHYRTRIPLMKIPVSFYISLNLIHLKYHMALSKSSGGLCCGSDWVVTVFLNCKPSRKHIFIHQHAKNL